jgi:hypothetical protein
MGIRIGPGLAIKSMSKDARKIILGVYDIVSEYQDDVYFDVAVVETAARRCTPPKYLNMAKRWVKVPKIKSIDDWQKSLSDFAHHFEKVSESSKGISWLHRNRDSSEIEWNMNMSMIYNVCSQHIVEDWNSYEDMDLIINWANNYSYSLVVEGIKRAIQQDKVFIRYIDAILLGLYKCEVAQAGEEYERISQGLSTMQFKKSSAADDLNKSIIDKAREAAKERIQEKELQNVFRDED